MQMNSSPTTYRTSAVESSELSPRFGAALEVLGYLTAVAAATRNAYGVRPRPLEPRSTEEERQIHASFIRDVVKSEELWKKHGRQGQPVFSARTDLAIEGVSDTALSYSPRPGRPPRIPMHGSVGAIVEALGAFQEIGVDHVVFETSTQSHHGALATMEAFMQKVQPQLA